jgi:hypothetical protein
VPLFSVDPEDDDEQEIKAADDVTEDVWINCDCEVDVGEEV